MTPSCLPLILAAAVASAALAAQPDAPATAAQPADPPWRVLLDGTSLDGWKPAPFYRPGDLILLTDPPAADAPEKSPVGPAVFLGAGDDLTGIVYTNPVPTMGYEIRLDAMRVSGGDFFCGLTFPVGTHHCTLIVGGWGGMMVGISSLDGMDASENESSSAMRFDYRRWYDIGVRVTANRISATIDGKRVFSVSTEGRRINMRPGEIEDSLPFGISAWRTDAAIRNVRIRWAPHNPDADEGMW